MRIVVAGGGPGGLMTAVLLARAGHEIVVLERDRLPEHAGPEAGFRAGAPQIVQPHVLLPRFRLLLRDALPDVHAALLDAGVTESPLTSQLPSTVDDHTTGPDDDRFTMLLTRRSTVDQVLTGIARAEPGVTLRTGPGAVVRGLRAEPGDPPRVTGVGTDAGRIDADVVVDATGRRTPVDRWLAGIGAAPSSLVQAEAGIAYYSRHYRLRTDVAPPARPDNRTVVPLDEVTVGIWGADNGTVQLGVCPLAEDTRFRAVRDPDVFTAVLRAVPPFDAWLDALEPITGVFAMGGLHNTLRRLVVDGRPVATGLHAVADSVCTTNPTLGRGFGIALRGALDLAGVLAAHPDDPYARTMAADDAVAAHVEPYYRDQARLDGDRLASVRAAVHGTPPPVTRDVRPDRVTFAELSVTAPHDAAVFRALATVKGMLDEPENVYTDPAVVARTRAVLARHHGAPPRVRPDWARILDGVTSPA